MPEYTKHIERRGRVEAVQFLNVEDASWFAGQFHSSSWSVDHGYDDCDLVFTLTVHRTPGDDVVIHRGDYLVRNGTPWLRDLAVVPYAEFRKKWEPDE